MADVQDRKSMMWMQVYYSGGEKKAWENLHFQRRWGNSKILSITGWLMLLLDSNVPTGHRFKLHLVCHSENPHAFKNVHGANLALYYQSNLTAWIPRALFKDYHHHYICAFFHHMSMFTIITGHYSVCRTHVQDTACTYFTIYLIPICTGPSGT